MVAFLFMQQENKTLKCHENKFRSKQFPLSFYYQEQKVRKIPPGN